MAAAAIPVTELARRATDFIDGKRVIGGYLVSLPLAIVALVLYALLSAVAWYQWATIKKQKFMLTLTIGSSTMALGYAIRAALHSNYDSVGVYAISTLFVLLSPCAFLALDYMLLSRLANHLGPDTVAKRCLPIRTNWIAKFFVTMDVVTFCIQGGGGGLQTSNDPDMANLGHKIALVGVIIQAVAFGVFSLILIWFGIRVRQLYPEKWHVRRQHGRAPLTRIFDKTPIHDWRILYTCMLLTCIAFITRSVFRAIEFAGGYDGYVQTTEAFFYTLDALPIFLGLLVFIAFYPPRFFMDRIFWDAPALSETSTSAPLDKQDSFRMSQMKTRSDGYSRTQEV
ncbi:hypothetical protein P389DRAFT_73817 [Cystobasidium minutum MCA 4210]|uniref:uncharacterized protein n=1 Tax=Cystobasidium minutum MCA 4210 TaxID=1397322 RepID=UPI0034CEC4B3|eukprot:jgi/Rhomi1/73817/CE73816_2037